MIIKEIREGLGLSQTELAKDSGVSRSFLSEIEGNKKTFSDETADKLSTSIAKFMEISYIAGLFDRRSTIDILRITQSNKKTEWNGGWTLSEGYIARVEFRSKHKILTNIVKNFFGCGSLTSTKQANGTKNYTYMAWSENAEDVLNTLLPYLKLKRKQAELVLKLREFQNTHIGGSLKYSTKNTPEKEERIRQLKSSGLTHAEIAKKVNLSEGTIFNILHGLKSYKSKQEKTAPYLEDIKVMRKLWAEIKLCQEGYIRKATIEEAKRILDGML